MRTCARAHHVVGGGAKDAAKPIMAHAKGATVSFASHTLAHFLAIVVITTQLAEALLAVVHREAPWSLNSLNEGENRRFVRLRLCAVQEPILKNDTLFRAQTAVRTGNGEHIISGDQQPEPLPMVCLPQHGRHLGGRTRPIRQPVQTPRTQSNWFAFCHHDCFFHKT